MDSLLRGKRGGAGGLLVKFFSFVAIILILVLFVFVSKVWKIINEAPAGLISASGERDFASYMKDEHLSLAGVRFAIAGGKDVNGAISEVGYNEK